jgi:bacterioferritin (cytochrome b1)
MSRSRPTSDDLREALEGLREASLTISYLQSQLRHTQTHVDDLERRLAHLETIHNTRAQPTGAP